MSIFEYDEEEVSVIEQIIENLVDKKEIQN